MAVVAQVRAMQLNKCSVVGLKVSQPSGRGGSTLSGNGHQWFKGGAGREQPLWAMASHETEESKVPLPSTKHIRHCISSFDHLSELDRIRSVDLVLLGECTGLPLLQRRSPHKKLWLTATQSSLSSLPFDQPVSLSSVHKSLWPRAGLLGAYCRVGRGHHHGLHSTSSSCSSLHAPAKPERHARKGAPQAPQGFVTELIRSKRPHHSKAVLPRPRPRVFV